MSLRNHSALLLVAALAIQGCDERPQPTKPAPQEKAPTPDSTRKAITKTKPHGYENSVNRLSEGPLAITDKEGKPAMRDSAQDDSGAKPISTGKLEVVWTQPTQFSWNYYIPELHGGKDIFETKYPSTPLFLKRKLGAKTQLEVSIPDTPYSFYIINGKVTPYFYDSEKSVIWQLNSVDLNQVFNDMRSIEASSKKIQFAAYGGDMAEFLVVDFSDKLKSPKVTHWVRHDGF
jgi:hypothetical protein